MRRFLVVGVICLRPEASCCPEGLKEKKESMLCAAGAAWRDVRGAVQ